MRLPDETRYSFVFGGVSQLIDGIFVTPALQDKVAQVQILHVNADFPDALAVDVSPEMLPFKTTDHDLPLLILQLDEQPTPVPGATAVPDPTPINIEPVNHPDDVLRSRVWWLVTGLVVIVGGGTAVFLLNRKRTEKR